MSSRAPISHVFITGASRSGTTLMSRILGRQSELCALRELHYFGDVCSPHQSALTVDADVARRMAERLSARMREDLWLAQVDDADRRSARAWCASLGPHQRTPLSIFAVGTRAFAERQGKRVPCEQTPRNAFYAQELLEALPGARFVHLVRDPRAVLASQKNRWRLRRLGAVNVPWSESLRTRINYHPITMSRLWNRAAEVAGSLRDHPRFLTVRFEDLVQDPAGEVRRICDFLDVAFEDAMLDVPQWGSSNVERAPGARGVSSQMSEQWKSVVSEAELEIVDRVSGALMDDFGYERTHRARSVARLLMPAVSYPFHLAGVTMVNPTRAMNLLRSLSQRRPT